MARVSKVAVDAKFHEIKSILKEEGDKNYCAILAIAALTGVCPKAVRTSVEDAGRMRGDGTHVWQMIDACKNLGFKMMPIGFQARCDIISQYPGVHKNLRHITTHHPRRFSKVWANKPNMLMITANHAAAYIDGVVVDWSVNTSLRINELYTIVSA